jgi:hypothetical protein
MICSHAGMMPGIHVFAGFIQSDADARDKRSVRGHSRHPFEGMADTSAAGGVLGGSRLRAKEDNRSKPATENCHAHR